MTLSVKTVSRGKVLNVHITGEFSLDEARRNFGEIIAALKESRSEKVLIDGRDVTGDPTIIERYYYGEFAADAVIAARASGSLHLGPQFAYVLHEPVLDPLRLGETVAANRGMHVKAFDNHRDAVQWLGLAPQEIVDFARRSVDLDQT